MKTQRLYLYCLISRLLPETRFFTFKAILLRWCGAKVSSGVRINSSTIIQGCGELEIGKDVWIGPCTHIMADGGAKVCIGDNVDIAPHVFIGTGSHDIAKSGSRIAGKGYNKSIVIGTGAWICTRAVILPGVEIGAMSVVAAGAVVAHDVSDGVVAGGVPCREIRKI